MYKRNLLKIAVSIFTIILMGFSAWAVPGTINYQGKLTDPNAVSMDGHYIMEFYLYTAESGGSYLWTEQQNIAVTNGVYNVELGKTSAFPPDLFDNETLYLEVKVFSTGLGWETLSPRQHLTSTPFAMKAGYASTAGDADTLDGLHTSDLFNPGDDYGRSGVAANLYEGTNTLTDRYVNEAQAGSITNSMIVNDAVTSNKIADGAVGTSDLSGNAVTSAKIQDGTIRQSDLSFGVPDGHSLDAADGNPSDAVYVDNSGNVGIGTTTPWAVLSVDRDLYVGGHALGGQGIRLEGTGIKAVGTAMWQNLYLSGSGIMGYEGGNVILQKDGGNVGIGTTIPAEKLDINGNLRFTEEGVTRSIFVERSDGIDEPGRDLEIYAGECNAQMIEWMRGGNLRLHGGRGYWPSGGDVYVYGGDTGAHTANLGNVILAHNGSVSGGNVGIGTTTPNKKLEVNGDVCFGIDASGGNGNREIQLYNYYGNDIHRISSKDSYMEINPRGTLDPLVLMPDGGNVGIGTTNPQGRLDVNGTIYQRGSELHADYVFEPGYKLESIREHSEFMWNNKHLKAIPKAKVDENGQEIVEVGVHQKGIVEELEKAHIYIEQLHNRLETLEAELADLRELKDRLSKLEVGFNTGK